MKNIDKLNVQNPIIHATIAIILGILDFNILYNDKMGAVIFTVSLFLVYSFIYEKKYLFIFISFILIGFLSCGFYYNVSKNKSGNFKFRVEKSYKDYYTAVYKGRKVYIDSDYPLEKNELLYVKGKYKEEIDIDKGVSGYIFVKEIIKKDKDFIYNLKNLSDKYYNKLSEKIGKENSAIATALVFGNKDYLEYENKKDLKDIGVIHLICISGFHIAFIYMIIRKLIRREFALVITFVYVVLTGMGASALRAYIMLLLLEIGVIIKKNYNSISALAISALILLLFRPYYLLDIGFQLSYFATLGILLLNEKIQRILYRVPSFISKSISLSISAQVFIYPIMILTFNTFSLNFLLGTFVLTPIVCILLPVGIIALICILLELKYKFIYYIIMLLFNSLNKIIEILKVFSVETSYCEDIYAIVYLLILIIFYLIYNGYLDKIYFKFSYFLVMLIFIMQFNIFPSVYIYKDSFNTAIVLEKGLKKVAYTNKNNEFFHESIRKNCNLNDIKLVKKDLSIELSKKSNMIINDKVNGSFIMLRDNNYDIIDLLNEDERMILIGNKIYISERGHGK